MFIEPWPEHAPGTAPLQQGPPWRTNLPIPGTWFLQGCRRVKGAAVGKLLCSVPDPKLAVPGGDLLPTPPNFWSVFSHLPAVAILFCKHSSHLYRFWFQSGFTWLEIVLVWCTSFPIKANPCPPCQSKHSNKGSGIVLTVNKIFFHIMLYRTHCCRHFLHLYYMVLLHLLDWRARVTENSPSVYKDAYKYIKWRRVKKKKKGLFKIQEDRKLKLAHLNHFSVETVLKDLCRRWQSHRGPESGMRNTPTHPRFNGR